MDIEYFKRFELDYKRKSHGGEIHSLSNKEMNSIDDYSININPLMELFVKKYQNDEIFDSISDKESRRRSKKYDRIKPIYENIFKKINLIYQKSFVDIIKYPDSDSAALKKVLSSILKIMPENIIIGAGAMDLMDLFCQTFIKPKDNVLILQPTFSEFEWAVVKNGGVSKDIFRKPGSNFKIDAKYIINLIEDNIYQDQSIKCIYLCNPNNPNGAIDSKENIKKILEYTKSHNIFLFLDESFIEFVYSEEDRKSFIDEIEQFPNLFICRSLTKFYGIPGLRIGYGIGCEKMLNTMKQKCRLWSVNSIAQDFMLYFLNDHSLNDDFTRNTMELIEEEKRFMIKELLEIKGLRVFPSDVNFLLINCKDSGFTAGELKAELLKYNILIRNCDNYPGLDGYYFRVCIKDHDSNMRLIGTLKDVLMS